jgi:hypothetical protein
VKKEFDTKTLKKKRRERGGLETQTRKEEKKRGRKV